MKKPTLAILFALSPACAATAQAGFEWSSYFGTHNDTWGHAMKTDAFGKIYICGQTNSSATHVTPGAFQSSNNGGYDAYVACLDPSLPPASQLVWGTHIGGSADDKAFDLHVTAAGDRVVVVGSTQSVDFPVTSGAFQSTYGGGFSDAFIAEFSPAATGTAQLVWASYFGGNGEDYASTVDQGLGGTTVGGVTASTTLPATPGCYQPVHGGGQLDLFVARFQPGGTATSFMTYLGGSADESVSATWAGVFQTDLRITQLAVDNSGRTIIGTATASPNLLTTGRPYNPADYDVYVAQLDAAGSQVLAATYLGDAPRDALRELRLDGSSVILVGNTRSPNFPITTNALQSSANAVDWSGFLTHLDLNTTQPTLLYSTYVAYGTHEYCTAAARTPYGDFLITGWTGSSSFPVPSGWPRPQGAVPCYLMRLRPGSSSTELVYSTVFGGTTAQGAYAIEPDGRGGAIVAGSTISPNFPITGNAFDPNFLGIRDAFVSIHEMLPAGVSRLGTATTPCMARTYAQMNGAPAPGASFDVECHDAPALAVGGLVVGIAQQPLGVGVPVFNCLTFVNPSLLIGSVLTSTNTLGFASVPLTIPPSIPPTGNYAFQFFWINPPSCAPSGFLTASNALRW